MQLGGSMSPETEYVPLDLTWKDVGTEVRSTPEARLPKADLRGLDKYTNYQLDGLESDKAFMYDKIENLKTKLEQGPGEGYSREQYNADLRRLRNLVTVGVSGLKQKEARFRDVTTSAAPARGDLAINNGKAFVTDSSGNYSIVPVEEMMTAKDEKGNLKYTPQSVGSALEHRASNMSFHGYGTGSGEQLEELLRSIVSSSDVEKRIKSAFTGVGKSVQSQSGVPLYMGQSGNSLVDFLETQMYGNTEEKKTFKQKNSSNYENLKHAYNAFMSTAESSGIMEALKRNAYGEYMAQFGSTKNRPDAEKWVEGRVQNRLNSTMLSYLKDEGATGASGSGGSGSGKNDLEVNVNQLSLALAKSDVKRSPTTIYGHDGEPYDIETNISSINDSSLFDNNEGMIRARQSRTEESIAKNSILKDITAGNSLKKNMVIASVDNIPLDELSEDGSGGLDTAMLDPDFVPQIMHNVLTYRKQDGSYGIAWDLTDEANRIKAIEEEQIKNKSRTTRMTDAELLEYIKDTDMYKENDEYQLPSAGVNFRKVLHSKVWIPINERGFLNIMTKSYTTPFKEMLYKTDINSDRNRKRYEQLMVMPENSIWNDDNPLNSATLHSFNTFSVLDIDTKITTIADQYYKSNKKSREDIGMIDNIYSNQEY